MVACLFVCYFVCSLNCFVVVLFWVCLVFGIFVSFFFFFLLLVTVVVIVVVLLSLGFVLLFLWLVGGGGEGVGGLLLLLFRFCFSVCFCSALEVCGEMEQKKPSLWCRVATDTSVMDHIEISPPPPRDFIT